MAGSMEPRPFRVPFGLTANGLVATAAEASKELRYSCPACRKPLTLRAGAIKRRHFAHQPDAVCSPETAFHEGAKLRLAGAVTAWRAGVGPRPVVVRICRLCGADVASPLSDHIVDAITEFRLASGRVIDVALLDSCKGLWLAVEILVTHEVDEAKAGDLRGLNWIEIEASALEVPFRWTPRRVTGTASRMRCQACEARRARQRDLTTSMAAKYGVDEPGPGYLAVESACRRCRRRTPVFFWKDMRNGVPPPEPPPTTVKRHLSRARGQWFWTNSCVRCDAIIGTRILPEILQEGLANDPDYGVLYREYFEDINDGYVFDNEAEAARLLRSGE